MFYVELHQASTSNNWILYTGCENHIFSYVWGLKGCGNLKHGELDLIMGNKSMVNISMIRDYELSVPSSFSIS